MTEYRAGTPGARTALDPIAYPRHEMPARPVMRRALMLTVFQRDRWTCRYCGGRTIFTPVMALLGTMFPDVPFPSKLQRGGAHPSVISCSAIVDQVIPDAHGGNCQSRTRRGDGAGGEEIADEAGERGRGDVSGRGRPVVCGAPGGERRGPAAVPRDGGVAAPHALEVQREGVDERGEPWGRSDVQHERNKYADSTL